MGKLDYTNSDLKNRYKALVKDPSSDLSKITVASDEKRTRAELLDILEELFENDELVFNTSFQEKFKAMLHIMIKSIDNSLDDGVAALVATNTAKTGITSGQASAITANTAKTGITTNQASTITDNKAKVSLVGGTGTALSFGEMITTGRGKTAKYSIVMTAVKSGVSKSITLELAYYDK